MILNDPNITNALNTIIDELQELKSLILKQNKPFINIEEASSFLNLSKHTLYRYCSQNFIPFYKVNSVTYFSVSELEDWVLNKKNKRKSNTELQVDAQTYLVKDKNKKKDNS